MLGPPNFRGAWGFFVRESKRYIRSVMNGRFSKCGVILIWLACFCVPMVADSNPGILPPLDSGFRSLYNLDFSGAQQQFSLFEEQHADNPLGPVAQAAGFLFSEFHRLGVLEGQFYTDDSK